MWNALVPYVDATGDARTRNDAVFSSHTVRGPPEDTTFTGFSTPEHPHIPQNRRARRDVG
eukprot:5490294-Prymnesium_polylepis.1